MKTDNQNKNNGVEWQTLLIEEWKTEEIKQMAEAKALEKYPVEESFKGCTYCEWGGGIEDINEEARFVYSQAVIDTYKEDEMMNDKLVEAIKELIQELDWAYADEDNSIRPAKKKVEAIINESAQQQENNEGEWISVKDRLPEKEGYYLGYTRDKYFRQAKFQGGVFHSDDYDGQITHYQKLPNPPKEK